MNISSVASSLPLIFAIAYTLLLLAILARNRQKEAHSRWFIAFLVASAVWELVRFFLPDPLFPAVALATATLLLAATSNAYLDLASKRKWLILGGFLLLLGAIADVLFSIALFPAPERTALPETPGSLVAIALWASLQIATLSISWRTYRRTRLPWHSNRLLHWFSFVLITFVGELLLLFTAPPFLIAGQISRLVGVMGLGRAATSHRLFDVRARLRKGFGIFLVALFSAVPATIVLAVTLALSEQLSLQRGYAFTLTLIFLAASFLLYQPFRRFIERIIYRYLLGEEFQTGKVIRGYGQTISRTLDVEQLSMVIVSTMSELLETTRGALMLVTFQNDSYEIEPIPALGLLSRERRQFPIGNQFVAALANEHQPLLQYDLDFSPIYDHLENEDRAWLARQAMEVYVPVVSAAELVGIIALGPKRSGLPYRANELELVQVLADQTVIALQNARLYRELNTQYDRIRKLNQDLLQQNERLEVLDKSKADFITIASHELRTPLTQVKGYADILTAMNEEAALTREQTREIVRHISRATKRLESLITAMLDASELEVSGMQLNVMMTRLEAIIRTALEPYRTALRQRHLQLELVGVEEIPRMEADFKRLVQGFENLIGNAIKYTPDYGMITISASLAPSVNGEDDFVEVVVADTGIGIDPRYHELVFEKFFRVGSPNLHSSGATKFMGAGPGLGLHIARGVIEAHGGRIWVESEEEDTERLPGSKFHVILPLQPLEQDPISTPIDAFTEAQAAELAG